MTSAVLKRQLANLPASPGVYEFFNAANKLLYVGKAKSLRSRVRSYFQSGAALSPAKQIMVSEVNHLTYTQVTNETEALLLEGSLIKQHQPPYNIVLKDDKSWLYMAIDYREVYPRVSTERRTMIRGVRYFGPYPAAATARDSLRLLKKVLGLRTCKNPANKPCFDSGLGRCLGHDLGRGSKNRYRAQLKNLEYVLRGNVRELIAKFEQQMSDAARRRQFERAAKLRDQRRALERLAVRQNVLSVSHESYDVLGLAQGITNSAVCRIPVRHGVVLEQDRFLVHQAPGTSANEALGEFLEQYYPHVTNRPRRTYLPMVLDMRSLLGMRFAVPERGKKLALVKMANAAAVTHLTSSMASWKRREARTLGGLKELQALLRLPQLPKRIEGYDISNIQGHDAVGSMVVLTHGLPDPSQYRKFRIQGPGHPNDFRMLAQMLERRFTKNHDWPAPDLIMLDGGAGQLSVVQRVLDTTSAHIPLVALAKREKELYLPGRAKPLKLARDNAGLLLLMELSDEAHRFGIGFFRKRHRRTAIQSQWDELPGVGPITKRKLKAAFGTLANLQRATLAELSNIVGAKRAQMIKGS